jgi:hypothetical protein
MRRFTLCELITTFFIQHGVSGSTRGSRFASLDRSNVEAKATSADAARSEARQAMEQRHRP